MTQLVNHVTIICDIDIESVDAQFIEFIDFVRSHLG